MAKPQYFIRQEGTIPCDTWHGPFEVFPKNKLKQILKNDPNQAYDYTVYECKVVPVDWDKL